MRRRFRSFRRGFRSRFRRRGYRVRTRSRGRRRSIGYRM
jgi:hypothetical protein